MSTFRRALLVLTLALISGAVIAPAYGAQDKSAPGDRPQILWQRTLEDALVLASAEQRPLLVAINVDGESASDRIVNERYRDPRFVEWTSRFACVVASISRHNPRDFDTEGRRIPCPRLGEVTCGEHIALEPILFERYLGGERVSPRHALIQPDNHKTFDLFLLFDLAELDEAIARCAAEAPPPIAEPHLPPEPARKNTKERLAQWRTMAASRTARGRERFETVVEGVRRESWVGGRFESWLVEALDAIAEVGDAGSTGVLRGLLNRTPLPSNALLQKIGDTAATLKVGSSVARIVRERLAGPGKFPGSPLLGDDRDLLPLLARFDASTPATRSFLLAHSAIGEESERRAAALALSPSLPMEAVSRVAAAVESEGGACEFGELMKFAIDVGRALPHFEKPAEVLAPIAELELELIESDRALTADPTAVEAQERFGRVSLNLARQYIANGGGDPRLLLEDARAWLERAAQGRPNDVSLAFARARAAYLSSRFEEQERIALAAFGGYPARDALAPEALKLVDALTLGDGDVRRAATLLFDENKLEALRWVGDASARLIAARAGQDPALEVRGYVRGARALALVAVSPSSDETDWVSLASFLGALGLEREALCAWETGAARRPESNALRDGLNRALWSAGRLDLAPIKAEWIAGRFPDSGACAWHAGYAWILLGEDSRRELRHEAALRSYALAIRGFERSIELREDLRASSAHYIAISELGSAFALFELGRRDPSLAALARALRQAPSVLDSRDGLDRDVPDLIDALLEWRDGRKSSLQVIAVAESLAQAMPDNPRPCLMVSDTALREGLRADGRSPRTAVNDEGERVRLPSEEGDAYMRESIAVARMAVDIEANEVTRTQLAQSLSVHAERRLVLGDTAEAAPLLAEAAVLLGEEPPGLTSTQAALEETAALLRTKLGPARPVFRPGR
ncbi:MAG: hypothetical protein JNL28_11235 [Planctomycetes bacterium]|nr:hypothetical protein [Planctomycetota bacterium]